MSWGCILQFPVNKSINDGTHFQCSGTHKELGPWVPATHKEVNIFESLYISLKFGGGDTQYHEADPYWINHYSGIIMGAMMSQITSITIVYSTVYSVADQRKHQSSASLAFVRGIHRWPVNAIQMAGNAENVSIWWCHHVFLLSHFYLFLKTFKFCMAGLERFCGRRIPHFTLWSDISLKSSVMMRCAMKQITIWKWPCLANICILWCWLRKDSIFLNILFCCCRLCWLISWHHMDMMRWHFYVILADCSCTCK